MAEKAVNIGEGKALRAEDFFFGARQVSTESLSDILNLNLLEKTAIRKSISNNKGHNKMSAKELGISRRALYYKLRKYDI
jgi:transcriptional regulator with PAS, ATPase and Fis domain